MFNDLSTTCAVVAGILAFFGAVLYIAAKLSPIEHEENFDDQYAQHLYMVRQRVRATVEQRATRDELLSAGYRVDQRGLSFTAYSPQGKLIQETSDLTDALVACWWHMQRERWAHRHDFSEPKLVFGGNIDLWHQEEE